MMGAGDSDGDLAHLVADDADVEMEAAQLAADRGDRDRDLRRDPRGRRGSRRRTSALVIKCAALTAEQVRHHGRAR